MISEKCSGHDRIEEGVDRLSIAAVRSEERFVGFLRFAKWVGSVTLLTLMVIAWVGVTLLGRIDNVTHDYQRADAALIQAASDNRRNIAINGEAMKRIESDLAYIRREIDKLK